MRPFIFYSPQFSIPSFAFSLMLASLVATIVCYKMAPRRGLSQVVVLDLAIIGTIMGLIGARLFHVFVEEPRYYLEHPTHVYQIWRGGFVSYGVFLGFAVGWIGYLKIRHLDTLTYLDHMILFGGPIVDFFVRLGCLLAGCCFGTRSPYHSGEYILYQVFNNPGGDAGHLFKGVPLYPTQIWSMIAAVFMFFVTYWVDRRKTFKGQTALTFLMLYAVIRTVIELFRGDVARGIYFDGAVSTAQIMSALFFTTCLALYFYFKKKFPLPTPP
jgi:Prolipoprotein diacylglyceryltransferase